jgi:hypothetical protein
MLRFILAWFIISAIFLCFWMILRGPRDDKDIDDD